MKKIAVITDAVSPGFFFPLWHRYYGGLFGTEKLHVVTYKGLKSAFSDIALGNLWEVDEAYDDTLRIGVIADLIAVLLRSHNIVVRCDVDEFLVPDSRLYRDFSDFLQRCELPYVTAQGIDVVELADDKPLDLGTPIFGVQRHYGIRSAALNKTCVTTKPLRWAEGFHGANVPPRFAGLYNLHMKFADLKRRIAWDETVVQGLVPGSAAHDYFSVGAAHLAGVQSFLASRPIGGGETQAAFDARYLATVGHNQANGIYQGSFLRQEFLVPLRDLGIAMRDPAQDQTTQPYNGLTLTESDSDLGVLRCLEEPQTIPRLLPDLVTDLSGRGIRFAVNEQQHIHGSYLVQRYNVLLFGPNILVDTHGLWSCEAHQNKEEVLGFFLSPTYASLFPGLKPEVRREAQGNRLITVSVGSNAEDVDEPVFLATPREPCDWGRWITTMPAKIEQYRKYGAGRKFFCPITKHWQRAFLQLLAIPEEAILPHDPGRTYICRDVMTVEYSSSNMSVSRTERANLYEIVATRQARGTYPRKLFVSRSNAVPPYFMLQNEEKLKAALAAMGFVTIAPEILPLNVQIGLFAAAEQIIFLGGAAVYNAVFCAPGSSVITIEPTAIHVGAHTEIFASLNLRHGVLFGAEELSDPQSDHRRWTLDVERAVPVIEAFFGAG